MTRNPRVADNAHWAKDANLEFSPAECSYRRKSVPYGITRDFSRPDYPQSACSERGIPIDLFIRVKLDGGSAMRIISSAASR